VTKFRIQVVCGLFCSSGLRRKYTHITVPGITRIKWENAGLFHLSPWKGNGLGVSSAILHIVTAALLGERPRRNVNTHGGEGSANNQGHGMRRGHACVTGTVLRLAYSVPQACAARIPNRIEIQIRGDSTPSSESTGVHARLLPGSSVLYI